jgi:hypothetical protein
MTPQEFRRIALSLPEAEETYRRGQWEFRLERRVFASLRGPGDSVAVVLLTVEQQSMLIHAWLRSFMAAPGGSGRLGETYVLLASANEEAVETALGAAWKNVASKKLLKRTPKPPST